MKSRYPVKLLAICAMNAPLVASAQSRTPASDPAPSPQPSEPSRAQQPATQPAQPPPPPRARVVLTLVSVVQRARENAPAVLVAVERARAAQAQIAVSRAGFLPSISLSGGASVAISNGTQVLGPLALNNTNISLQMDASASMRWTLWDFGRTSGAVESAEFGSRAATLDIEAARRSAISSAVSAFYAVVLDKDSIENARTTAGLRVRSLEVARGYTEAGARPDIERTRAEVALASSRVDVANAEVQFRSDLVALAGALGVDAASDLDVASPSPLVAFEDPSLAAQRATVDRPEILANRIRTQQADQQVDNARRGLFPTLSASASAGVRYTANWRYTEPMWTDTRGPSESFNAGVTLSWAAFDPTVRANIRVAEANAAAARAQEAQSIVTVRTEAVQAVVAARAARQVFEQSEVLARGAAANLAQAQGRYEAGAGTMLELVDAQAQDAQARASLVRSRWQWEAAKARAYVAQGQTDSLR
ncbi:MAG: TolC family protein [Myxococcales bacterium]|nr:TolC family protein [Myxococcales bacterium]